jgi:hypothetical protein
MEADRVHTEGLLQVRRDFAQHLVNLDYLDGRTGRVQAERLAQFVNHADVDAGLEAAAKVHGHLVRFTVGTGAQDAFAGSHDGM